MQDMALRPYLAANNRILISLMARMSRKPGKWRSEPRHCSVVDVVIACCAVAPDPLASPKIKAANGVAANGKPTNAKLANGVAPAANGAC
jgi:hypothetical protein